MPLPARVRVLFPVPRIPSDEAEVAVVMVEGATTFSPEVVATLSTDVDGCNNEIRAVGRLLEHQYVIKCSQVSRQGRAGRGGAPCQTACKACM